MNGSSGEPSRHLAEGVARIQRERGLTNETLADRAGLRREELEEILGGKGQVPLDVVFLLAGALSVAPEDLLEGIAWIPDGEGKGEYRKTESE